MKMRALKPGAMIEEGDYLKQDNWTGIRWYKFTRTTAKLAMVNWNEKAEGKFQRVISDTGICKSGQGKDVWSQTQYSAWRPIKTDETGIGQ